MPVLYEKSSVPYRSWGTEHAYLLVGAALAIAYWFFEAFIHYAVLRHGPFLQQVLPADQNEIWMRTSFGLLIVGLFRVMDRSQAMRQQSERSLRNLSQRVIDSQEQERARVARDLHDALGQQLVGIRLEAGWLRDHAAQNQTAFDNLMAQILNATEELQRISKGLHPPMLDRSGLCASLRELITEFTQAFDCGVTLNMQDIPDNALTSHTAIHLYRIVQEALTNVMRHSGVRQATVSVTCTHQMLRLEIMDSGRGISPDAQREPTGLGIPGMEDRTRLCGGEFALDSTPGHGTRIRVMIPLPRDTQHSTTSQGSNKT